MENVVCTPHIGYVTTDEYELQFSEIFEYLHLQSRSFVQSATWPEGATHVKLDFTQWQQLLDLQSQLAEYLRKIGEPEAQ